MLALGSYIGYYHCHGLVRIGPAKVDVSQHTAYDSTEAVRKGGEILGMFGKKRWTEVFAWWVPLRRAINGLLLIGGKLVNEGF